MFNFFSKKNQKKSFLFLIPFITFSLYCNPNENGNPGANSMGINLPPGFNIEVYTDDVPGARSMALSDDGILFVSTRDKGSLYAVLDNNGDNKGDEVITLVTGLNSPNGIAFKDGALYVAEISQVWKWENIVDNLQNPPSPIMIKNDFPTDKSHGWKFIAIGPDDKLYVPVGAPCNICLREDDPRYASITRMNLDGSGFEVYAHGVRNTVGFDWHPETNELWFTDNGRDMMGDDIPPDELNQAPQSGMHFGYPFVHGDDIMDPEYGEGKNSNDYVKPKINLGPHVAALGMRFYSGNMFPAEYKNQIFIAEHGSWNRSKKIGYRVMLVRLEGNNAVSYEPFAEGWLNGESVSGRPVDVLVMPDGALLVSDDYAGAIYRISYN
jgi:glucose/arabinose dehydrogenase